MVERIDLSRLLNVNSNDVQLNENLIRYKLKTFYGRIKERNIQEINSNEFVYDINLEWKKENSFYMSIIIMKSENYKMFTSYKLYMSKNRELLETDLSNYTGECKMEIEGLNLEKDDIINVKFVTRNKENIYRLEYMIKFYYL